MASKAKPAMKRPARRAQGARAPRRSGPAMPRKDYTSPARLARIFAALDQLFPRAECALRHNNAFQLLLATILSAQCTDERVNKVTPELFRKYPTAQDFAALPSEALEPDIRSTGFFRNKAKSIVGTARKIVSDFGGAVPRTMDELLTLPGVARKTANVVLGTAYGIPSGVVVDTHVMRLSRRLDLTKSEEPKKIEEDLVHVIPKEKWIQFSHQLIWHGRRVCIARKPRCPDCNLESICYSKDTII